MTITDQAPDAPDVLATIDQQVRDLQEAGAEPASILIGPQAYAVLCDAVAAQFGREPADLAQYQWLPVVLDPFRGGRVCVVPPPRDQAGGVRAERL